jgi:hypothetical protein
VDSELRQLSEFEFYKISHPKVFRNCLTYKGATNFTCNITKSVEEGRKYGGKSQSDENNVRWHIYVQLVEDGTNSGPISCFAFVEE